MTLTNLIESIVGDYFIIITKKDGHFDDEYAHVSHKDSLAKWSEERKKARAIAERTDLILETILHEDGKDLLIGLREV